MTEKEQFTNSKKSTTKDDLNAMELRLSNELKRHFDSAVEIMKEECLGAREDEISNIKDQGERLEQRVSLLERHNGLAP